MGVRRALQTAAVGLAMLACTPLQSAPQPVKTGPDVIIGIPLGLTGNLSNESAMAKQGYDLWLDWVNERGLTVQGVRHRVRIQYADDTSKPDVTAQLAEQMITQNGASFLLGPYSAANTAAAAAVAERHHVPLISANGSARSIFAKGYRYVFGVQTPADRNLQVLFDLVATANPKPTTVAVLAADDSFSQEVAKGAIDYAQAKGLQIVYSQKYPNGSTNLYNLVNEVKTKNPDIVINSGHLLEAIAMNKAAMDLRLNAKMFAYSVGPTMPDFVKALGPQADYIVTGSQWTAQAQYKSDYYLTGPQYVAAYRKKFQTTEEPNYQVADATAAGITLEKAIEKAGSLDPEKVRDAIASLDLACFFGRIKFDSNGQNSSKPMLVEQIQSGHRQTVWPPELANTTVVYPAPSWTARLGPAPEAPKAKLPGTGSPPRR